MILEEANYTVAVFLIPGKHVSCSQVRMSCLIPSLVLIEPGMFAKMPVGPLMHRPFL